VVQGGEMSISCSGDLDFQQRIDNLTIGEIITFCPAEKRQLSINDIILELKDRVKGVITEILWPDYNGGYSFKVYIEVASSENAKIYTSMFIKTEDIKQVGLRA